MEHIEVKIAGKGSVERDGSLRADAGTVARCDVCKAETDAVARTGPGEAPFACKACLRGRLEAMTIATWQLKDAGNDGLPWGKLSG